jgi:hypothetical protein
MPDAIKPMFDGVELELESGETIRPVLESDDGQRLFANRVWTSSETITFGRDADDTHVTLTFEVQE